MKVIKTVKLEMTDKEEKALKTVFRMLYDLDYDDEISVASKLGYCDLRPLRTDLANLYALGGGDRGEL